MNEIAVHLYEEMGIDCLGELRGEFAFILWDERRQTLYAVHDRFGIISLFYAEAGNQVYLGSEAKALFKAGLPAAWDHTAVMNHLLGCLENDTSLFAGVRQVPLGHYLQVARGRVETIRYWDLDYPRNPPRDAPGTPEPYLPEIRAALEEAVQLRTLAHVPVGCLLSGGVDSSTVLALAQAHSSRPVQAFTIAFQKEGFNEIEKARRAASHVGAELHEIPVRDRDLADCFAEAAYHAEMVQYNAHGTARFLLTREIQRAGYRAVLAGEGADELFLGYGFVRAALAATGRGSGGMRWLAQLPRLLAPLNENEQQIAATSPAIARFSRLLPFSPELVGHFARALSLLRSLLAPGFVAGFARRDPYRTFLTGFPWRTQLLGRQPAHQILYLWLRSVFATYHLAADRIDLAHAVEVRYPFLDHHLFDYVKQIPVPVLVWNGVQKHLLREAASPWLPPAIWQGAKQPFYAPPATLTPKSPLLALLQETLRGPALAAMPFFEQSAVVALLDRLPQFSPRDQTLLDALLLMMASLCFIHDGHHLR